MPTVAERVADAVAPVLDDLGLVLHDVEHAGTSIRVVIDHDGGVDVDSLTTATRALSRLLDDLDPIAGHYTLEVSSPGFERAAAHSCPLRQGGRHRGERQDHPRRRGRASLHRYPPRRRRARRGRRPSGRHHPQPDVRRDRAGPHHLRMGACTQAGIRPGPKESMSDER